MSGNTIGHLFAVTNFGESHGPAIGCVIDGCPPGLTLTQADIQADLDRRKPGTSRHVTQRKEADQVEILSGVFEGKTTGTPIALLIRNQDARSKDYSAIAKQFRPGHADYTYWHKYGVRDYRGGGRSSARLTAPTVAAGAVARAWLAQKYGVLIRGYLSQIGEIEVPFARWEDVPTNAFFAADNAAVPALEDYMDQLRKDGDSCGARIEVVAENVPVGLGEPLYDKLDAELAYALMSLNAVKAIEIGAGIDAITDKGSTHGDSMTPEGFVANNAGGVLGGISSGQPIRASLAIKPTSSIRTERESIGTDGKPVSVQTLGRHDPCVGIRATPIAEALVALVLVDHALRHRAQNADVNVDPGPIPGERS
jgi:chorismate synthase